MATYTLGQAAVVSRGNYSSTAQYKQLNTVFHRGGTFMCISECSNVEPGVTSGWNAYWVQTAIGIYSGVVSASGANVTVTFTMSDGSTVPLTWAATAIATNSIYNNMLAEAIDISHGGTGATTAEDARSALGLSLPLAIGSGGTGGTDADGARGNLNAQEQASTRQVLLNGGETSWLTTLDINNNPLSDIKAGSNLIVAPAPASWADYRNYGVRMTAQANGSVTFTAESSVPEGTNLTVNILIFN